MIWIVSTIAVLALLGLLAAVLTGRLAGDPLSQAVSSVPDAYLPAAPTGADVARVHFDTALRGYRMSQVDEVLDRLQARIEEQDQVIAQLGRPSDPAAPYGAGPAHESGPALPADPTGPAYPAGPALPADPVDPTRAQ
ncbi:MAG: DivIVA domain-containing protein [Micrococcales bacterium]|nr:DivIVA domain-containing protein [Micrococcales bacterium]